MPPSRRSDPSPFLPTSIHTWSFLSLLVTLALAEASVAQAQIILGNVRAAQRSDTELVDIDYDITGIATPVAVTLEISSDGLRKLARILIAGKEQHAKAK